MIDISQFSDSSSEEIQTVARSLYSELLQHDRSALADDERFMAQVSQGDNSDAVMDLWLKRREEHKNKREAYLNAIDALKVLHDSAVEGGR